MKKLFTIALLASFTAIAAPFKWTCDWPEARSQTFSLYQGESATFEPTFRVNGHVVSNVTIEAVWYQTNGMGNAWWKLSGNTFAPSNDVGAATYRFFVEANAEGDDLLYRANGLLRLLPSPGFTPNTIELPVARLDFAAVEVANAPYYDKAETEAKIVELAPAPGNYAAVSNRAMTALQSFTETDPTVPAWAKAESKPSYSYNEISGTPDISAIARAATNYTDAAATLSPRRGPAIWTFNPATLEGGTFSVSPEDFEDLGWHWFLLWSHSESGSTATVAAISGDKSDTTVDFTIGSYMELPEELQPHDGESVIATLVTPELPGYVLGSQTNKPLASAEMAITNSADIASLKDTTSALRDSIPSVALTNETLYVNGWKTNVVTRRSNRAVDIIGNSRYPGTKVGASSIASGYRVTATGDYSLAWGNNSRSLANYARAYGYDSSAERAGSTAIGMRAVANNEYALSWQGGPTNALYFSHGAGTFNINPVGGTDGFWIGETNFAQHVRNIAGSGGGGSAAPKRVAMFIVPVNGGSPFTYTGFELKCSTNNFASAASESVKLQFYSQSEIADEGSGSTIDKMKLFACTSYFDDTRDLRSYSPIGNTIDYHNYLYSVVALVDVSCLKRHPEDNGSWLSEDNEDLVWCYMRDTANDVEREGLTTEPLWRPIAPVKWFRELPSWAR